MADHRLMAATAVGALIIATSILLALLGLYILAVRPEGVAMAPDSTAAVLLSRGGHRLHHWPISHRGYPFAQLVDRPRDFGGGRIALIAGTAGAPNDIAAFDPSAPGRILWTTRGWDLQFPAGESGHPEAAMTPVLAELGDYLPSSPGLELLVAHRLHGFSAMALRVFDLGGTVRYQAWHDGAFGGLLWLPSTGVAVVGALNCEASWDARGFDSRVPKRYPSVAFALKIQDGHLGTDWVVREGRQLDPTLQWYKWLGPCKALDAFQELDPGVISWRGPDSKGEFATIRFSDQQLVRSPTGEPFIGGWIAISVDPLGREVSRFVDESYRTRLRNGDYPEESRLRLLDYDELPAIRPIVPTDGPGGH